MSEHWRFTLLGRVRAWSGENEVELGPRQQKVVLAMLLLRCGVPVSMDQLIDGLWGAEPPITAAQTVRTYIYRLRRVLSGPTGESLIQTIGGGYLLEVDAEDLDLGLFRRQLHLARKSGDAHPSARTRDLLRSALTRWESEALAGLPGEYARSQRSELARQRLDLLEYVLSLEVRFGPSGALISEISAAVAAHPLDERFRALLMRALRQSGQRAQALAVYRETRAVLAEELGVDPGSQLQELYLQILRADRQDEVSGRPGSRNVGPQTGAAVIPPNQLPPDPRGFSGRIEQLAWLDAMLERISPAAATVVLLHGMAGAGKTALAVHWAHRVADRFPDGLLFLNLRGFDPSIPSTGPDEVLTGLLEALGVTNVPGESSAAAALYRSLLAGRRMLIMLDNARDADQLRRLLPGVPGVLIVITSRVRLSRVIAHEHAEALFVDVLAEDEARAMVLARLGRDRSDLDRAAVADVVALCGALPLALTLVTARVAMCPENALNAEIRPGEAVLDVLSDPDPVMDVRSAFSWSYRDLSPEAARLFRLLSVHPGPAFSTATAVGLLARSDRTVRAGLGELTAAHLIERAGPDRFVLHDLLRAFAGELHAAGEGPSSGAQIRRRIAEPAVPRPRACC